MRFVLVEWHSEVLLCIGQHSCDMQFVPVEWHTTVVLCIERHNCEPVTLSLDLLRLAIELAPSECLTKVGCSN